jgi:hypothetical protein
MCKKWSARVVSRCMCCDATDLRRDDGLVRDFVARELFQELMNWLMLVSHEYLEEACGPERAISGLLRQPRGLNQ